MELVVHVLFEVFFVVVGRGVAFVDYVGVDDFDVLATADEEGLEVLELATGVIVANHVYLAEGDFRQLHLSIILIQSPEGHPLLILHFPLRESHDFFL